MRLSKRTKDLIAECRWTAEKLENDFIGLAHLYLAYSKTAFRDKYDFKLTLTHKKELIKTIKGLRRGGAQGDLFPLTKDFETALRRAGFHRWILGDKEIDPIHIFLSGVSEDKVHKSIYIKTLADNESNMEYLRK